MKNSNLEILKVANVLKINNENLSDFKITEDSINKFKICYRVNFKLKELTISLDSLISALIFNDSLLITYNKELIKIDFTVSPRIDWNMFRERD